jgi:hypothetical protein
MLLYKFMGITPFERVANTLLGRRLYCPTPSELNDPLEGMLGNCAEGAEPGKPIEDQLRACLLNMSETDIDLARARVCCFSASPNSMQMWSYYAGGHKGLCLEVDATEIQNMIHEVIYYDNMEFLSKKQPVERLQYKHSTWQHEREYRLISIDEPKRIWLPIKIQSVLISASMATEFLAPISELCLHLKLRREIASFNTHGEFTRIPLNNKASVYESHNDS